MVSRPHLRVDRTACRGAGQCAYHAPHLFDQDDDEGLVILLHDTPSPADLPAARLAIATCPNQAITLTDR
ncbi:MAG TPA: ferredoxin [Thermomonospora sp.]|nr:ferredoxin [Thermomonospora sp.]